MNNTNELFELLSEDETCRIMSCLHQYVKNLDGMNVFTINVWFPEDANKRFNSNTPDNGFLIFEKSENEYTNELLIKQANKIIKNKLVPIEIIKNGICLFYALPKESVFEEKDLRNVIILPVEDIIPNIDDFYL